MINGLKSIGYEMSYEKTKAAFNLIDRNNDKAIDFEEFLKILVPSPDMFSE
jgi:hypothetical protein